jgi:hypothetical protein
LKLDTQGSDVEIAKSAGTSLTEFVGLQSEIAFQTIYEGTPDYLSALGLYRSAGFLSAESYQSTRPISPKSWKWM